MEETSIIIRQTRKEMVDGTIYTLHYISSLYLQLIAS